MNTWPNEVQEARYVLGKIETKTATSPRSRSRSVLQAKLLALEIKTLPKDSNVDVLISDVPQGESNRNLTNNQYSIKFPSFGLSRCTKMLCVPKKWWDIHSLNSVGRSNQISVHWSSHFKGLYHKKEIPLLVLKMEDNHLRNLFFRNMLKHGGNKFLHFDYYNKNKRSELIKTDTNVKKARVARKLTEIDSDTKKRRNVCDKDLPVMSVREVIF